MQGSLGREGVLSRMSSNSLLRLAWLAGGESRLVLGPMLP